VARYFEETGKMEKAVLLFQKGGKVNRALDLCFKANLFEALRLIADNLGPEVTYKHIETHRCSHMHSYTRTLNHAYTGILTHSKVSL
jgi:hypothetical protein